MGYEYSENTLIQDRASNLLYKLVNGEIEV